MENYTKYRLKPEQELRELLVGKDNIYIVACNKCFKEFTDICEPEAEEFMALCQAMSNTVTGSGSLDFLCNRPLTEKALEIPEGTQFVAGIAGGLGIQTVADLVNVPVIAVADSKPQRGLHGMALTKKACDACAQCYLNITGGICPVVDCAKSLVNGQCGGAKDGKCEVDPNMECGWERIYQKLKALDRLDVLKCPVQIRNYATDSEV